MKITYEISQIVPYINWVYFYYAWGIHSRPEAEQQKLRQEAEEALQQVEGRYHTYALFELYEAHSDGDDIVVNRSKRGEVRGERLPLLRQQQPGSECLCLSDFISPSNISLTSHLSPLTSKVGLFATSVSHGLETDFDADPYQKMLMQLLADRLAEATAERMHEEVRKNYWGYAADERLSIAEMQVEHFQGIRPAVGYPSLPDTSLNFVIDELQLMQAVLCGASAVLLIAACLTRQECRELIRKAHDLGLEVLLEMHGEEELDYADLCPDLCGINNRHLGSFVTDVENSFRLAERLPKEAVKVSESGISNPAVVRALREVGYRGFLIGENFMRTASPGDSLRQFIAQL